MRIRRDNSKRLECRSFRVYSVNDSRKEQACNGLRSRPRYSQMSVSMLDAIPQRRGSLSESRVNRTRVMIG